jgi:hypothetical protein
MQREDREHQASAFLAFHFKRGGDWRDDFGAWAATKEFTPLDELAIRTLVYERLLSGGAASIDLGDYFTGTWPDDAPTGEAA